jgi:hypothetical protein
MDSGYKKIYWGLLLANVHITLGALQILPNFVGWLIVASGAAMVYWDSGGNTSFKHAHDSVLIIAGISSLSFIISFTQDIHDIDMYITMTIPIFELVFIYYLLEGRMNYLQKFGMAEEASFYSGIQRIYMIIFIINNISMSVLLIIANGGVVVNYIVGLLLTLWLMGIVSDIRKHLEIVEIDEGNV